VFFELEFIYLSYSSCLVPFCATKNNGHPLDSLMQVEP
jgi:hypothetical protein